MSGPRRVRLWPVRREGPHVPRCKPRAREQDTLSSRCVCTWPTAGPCPQPHVTCEQRSRLCFSPWRPVPAGRAVTASHTRGWHSTGCGPRAWCQRVRLPRRPLSSAHGQRLPCVLVASALPPRGRGWSFMPWEARGKHKAGAPRESGAGWGRSWPKVGGRGLRGGLGVWGVLYPRLPAGLSWWL